MNDNLILSFIKVVAIIADNDGDIKTIFYKSFIY